MEPMMVVTLILIIAFFLATIIYYALNWKNKHERDDLLEEIREKAREVQATLPTLEPGALFTAKITPLPNNTIQFAIKLSPEARNIIVQHNLFPVRVLTYTNVDYAKEMFQYNQAQERLRKSPRVKDHVEASVMPAPEKNIDITIEYFAHPCGMTRSFRSASEAKAWTEQLREGLEVFQRELEANETPAETSTFTVMRKT